MNDESDGKAASRGWGIPRPGWLLAVAAVVIVMILGVWRSMIPPSSANATPQIALGTSVDHFDGRRALRDLQEICKLGPRMTATPAMRHQREIIRRHCEALGGIVTVQAFQGTQPSQPRPFECANMLVQWHPESKSRVLFGAHYDTRPIADRDPLPRNRMQPIIGANDGASGVAFLMELARVIPNLKLNVGVDFVFFDAEEYIFDPDRDEFFLGSEEFVRQLIAHPPAYSYKAVVVVDMIAGKNLQIHPDQRSSVAAGRLVGEIWGVAHEIKARSFHPQTKYDVLDDHIAFLEAGMNACVLIDMDYSYWHRLSDTPDKCSAASLQEVGDVLVRWLARQ